jgi:hypothetical protein
MVIEFAPKPQATPAADKTAVSKKPVDAGQPEPAPEAKPARPKAAKTSRDQTDESGELF